MIHTFPKEKMMERIVWSEVMMTFRCFHRNFRCNKFFKLHETKIVNKQSLYIYEGAKGIVM